MFFIKLRRRLKFNKEPKITAPPAPEPPKGQVICDTATGKVLLRDAYIHVEAGEDWEKFLSLLRCRQIYEVFLTSSSAVVSTKSWGRTSLSHPLDIERLLLHLIEETGARVDLKQPYTQLEYLGWRIFVQLDISGQLEITATRIHDVSPLRELVDPLLAARILTLLMAPSTVVIAGPPGSGKTTLLNSIIVEAASLWPHLHIAVVEPVKELVLNGGWASRMVGDISHSTRLTVRFKRPDILVVGELLTSDVWSFIEAGRSGVPTISTYHSPNIWKCLRSMADALRIHIPDATELTVLRYIDAFIITRKTISPTSTTRHIDSIYMSDGQRLIPLYTSGPPETHITEEIFLDLLPENSLLGPTATIYSTLKTHYKVPLQSLRFEKLPPLSIKTRPLDKLNNPVKHR